MTTVALLLLFCCWGHTCRSFASLPFVGLFSVDSSVVALLCCRLLRAVVFVAAAAAAAAAVAACVRF
jgi:hypothetical protein